MGSLPEVVRPGDDVERLMRRARIMMVDDEPINMEVLQIHLEAEGYSRFVCHAESVTAMKRLREESPDIVLLDLKMPEVDGFEILEAIRGDEDLKRLPVVVLTSSDDAETKLRALNLGATDFLSKPVDASELALRLRNTLSAQAYQRRVLHFDPLTELPNRRFFTAMVRRELARDVAAAECVVVNIRHFKSVNDSFGNEAGDELLWAFSERLQSAFAAVARDSESLDEDGLHRPLVARLGGDRFGVLISHAPDDSDDESLAVRSLERLVDNLQLPFVVDGEDVYLDIGAGICKLDASTYSVDMLINRAETAMLFDSHQTDGRFWHYADHMDEKARELLGLANSMRTAIENDEMFLVYQPKVDVATGKILGAEALLRWQHPQQGLVSPMQFIPIAEDSGAIVHIGEWVLEEACNQTRCWRERFGVDFRIAVNVSIRQLVMPNFPDVVRRLLDATGLPPDALIVELTENMIMDDAETNIARLHAVKALGVAISVDDFGTGYSSLSYLQRFPIDQLKVDRSFIMSIESEHEPAPIVKAVISLAHDLGLDVVAEGVENEMQLRHLQGLRCEQYQGFYFSRPVRATEFEQLFCDAQLKRSA